MDGKVFSPLPPECIYARCGCGWWIATWKQLRREVTEKGEKRVRGTKCFHCGELFRPVDQFDLDWTGYQLPEGAELYDPRKRRRRKAEPSPAEDVPEVPPDEEPRRLL